MLDLKPPRHTPTLPIPGERIAPRLAFEPAPKRRAFPDWRAFHDNEAGALQMFD